MAPGFPLIKNCTSVYINTQSLARDLVSKFQPLCLTSRAGSQQTNAVAHKRDHRSTEVNISIKYDNENNLNCGEFFCNLRNIDCHS